jgi:hypothetical protein
MSPTRSIATGILFLLLAAAGVIYVIARPKPQVVPLEPERLQFEKPQPSPAQKPIVREKLISTKHSAAPRRLNPIKQYAVRILTPTMAETFTAPAVVTLTASASDPRELKTIEFYKSPGETFCQSLSTPVKLPKELKIGETHVTPYDVKWNIHEPGTFIVRAVATYTSGEQQVSPPVVIIVKTEQKPAPSSSSVTTADHIKPSTARPALNRACPDVAETINYKTFFRVEPVTTVNICPDDPDDPLNTFTQLFLRSDVIAGDYSNAPSFEYWVNGGKILKQGAQTIWDLAELKSRPGVYTVIAKADDGCDCTNIQTQTVVVTNSCTQIDPFEPPQSAGGENPPPPTRPISDPAINLPLPNDSTATAAKRSAPKVERSQTPPENVEVPLPAATPAPNTATPRRTNEKDWMKISWTPFVKSDDSVTIKVVYNRTTESLHISNAAGEVSEELKLARLLRDWFGDDYQTFGDVRLRTAGLKCDSCNQEQYQSFDKEKLEWSWPLKPEDTGRQSFNIELWVKGEPRDKNLGKQALAPEKVWSSIDNKIEVTEPFLTRNTVYMGGGLFGVLGLGLCLRGFKGQFHVGDTYNVENAVAVGRNVTMTNTTVNQETNGEKRDA